MPETRQIIRHHIIIAFDVGESDEITKVTLVNGLQAEEVGWNTGSGGRSLSHPGESRGIVGEGVDGTLTAVDVVYQDIVLRNSPG
jgi:hypothetical protein